MMMNQTSAGSMSDALGGGKMPTGGLSPQFVNPASMSPIGMANLQGSPMANGGANLNHYNGVAEHMMPPDQDQMGGVMPQMYRAGGVVGFAAGQKVLPTPGLSPLSQMKYTPAAPARPAAPMPPPARPMPAPAAASPLSQMRAVQKPVAPVAAPRRFFAEGGMTEEPMGGLAQAGMAPQEGGAPPEGDSGISPELKDKVTQIFSENMENPEQIAQLLLELVKEEIAAVVSPEEMQYLQTPEGENELQQIVQEIMAQVQGAGGDGGGGGLAQMMGGGGGEGGPPPPEAGAMPPPGMGA